MGRPPNRQRVSMSSVEGLHDAAPSSNQRQEVGCCISRQIRVRLQADRWQKMRNRGQAIGQQGEGWCSRALLPLSTRYITKAERSIFTKSDASIVRSRQFVHHKSSDSSDVIFSCLGYLSLFVISTSVLEAVLNSILTRSDDCHHRFFCRR